jgi:hypothetical protein
MAFPVPGLTFIRCADTSPAGTTIQDFLDAIYNALSAANDYRGTAKPASHAWTFTRRQVTGVTNAVTCEAPAALGLISPVVIFAGRTLPGTPTTLTPDITAASVPLVGVNKNGGAYNSWDAALPMTSGQFSGYWRAGSTGSNAVATVVRCFVSQETIFVQVIQTATIQSWVYAGALLQPYTNDTSLACETDGRLYGMVTPGSAGGVSATWLTTNNVYFSHSTTASATHAGVFQPNGSAMYACGTRHLYNAGGGAVAELTDLSGAFIGDIMEFGRNTATGQNAGTRLGTLRGIYRAGSVQSGRYLRSGATDLYHYVSVDTANPAHGLMLPSVA